jgi:DNA-binding response OmpR family regulator
METKKTKVLLAEDDRNLGSILKAYLEAKGFPTHLSVNGEEAFNAYKKEDFDFCIVDVMMPVKDGFTLASEIRILNSEIPIIFLTAKSMKEDVLEGFTLGADDYITKPFSMEELLFRIEAILRRTKGTRGGDKNVWEVGSFSFDAKKQILTGTGTQQKLTTKESELLKLLCNNINQVLERNFALKAIWIDDNYFNARSMDVYITKLRKYLKADPNVQIINVHGKGYKLVVDEE